MAEGEGEFTDAGKEKEESDWGGYPFDTTDRDASLDALGQVGTMNPDDPDFAEYLEALNAAYALGTLTEDDMRAAGLSEYNGTWIGEDRARLQHADDAINLLNDGGVWEELSGQQQAALADTEPDYAIQMGGLGHLMS